MSGQPGANVQLSSGSEPAPLRAIAVSPATLGVGMQLVRASNLTMSRFQLALQSGDRRLATKAMDNILDIDAEMECFVADLGCAAANEPHMEDMEIYLASQKDAVAREKHALVGHVGKVEQIRQAGDDAEDRTMLELDLPVPSTVQAAAAASAEPHMGWVPGRPLLLLAVCAFCVGVALAALMLAGLR